MVKPTKLDLGAGKAPQAGFTPVDIRPWDKRTFVTDLCKRWPWNADSVDEVYSRNLLHLLTQPERRHFMHELHRVLRKGAKATVITPHWCSNWAYADPGVQWPPVSEGWYFHLNREWRERTAPWAEGYSCDFDFTAGYGMHQHLVPKNQEYQAHAIQFWKEAAQDLHVTLTKR